MGSRELDLWGEARLRRAPAFMVAEPERGLKSLGAGSDNTAKET